MSDLTRQRVALILEGEDYKLGRAVRLRLSAKYPFPICSIDHPTSLVRNESQCRAGPFRAPSDIDAVLEDNPSLQTQFAVYIRQTGRGP